MENSIHLKYLVISPTDLKWGMTINSVGFQNIAAHNKQVKTDIGRERQHQ